MNTTALAFKKQVINNAANAAAGAPPVSCGPNCQACRRVDLQLLVVTPSVVAKEHAGTLKSAGHAWATGFDAEFGSVKRVATLPVARIARPGYLMVFFPARSRWDVWQVMEFGLTRKIMHQVDPVAYGKMYGGFAKAPPAKACSRKAANLKAQLISIEGAAGIDKVWIAYSDSLWTKATLQRYADNPSSGGKKIRELRGREMSPKAILAGTLPKGGLLLDKQHLEQSVADFVTKPGPGFKAAFASALKPLDQERFGKAGEFDEAVRAIEKSSAPSNNAGLYLKKSVILMVPDPVGVTVQHNKLRSAVLSGKQGWLAGGPDATGANADPDRPWKRQSMLNAGYIKEWVTIAQRQRMDSAIEAVQEMGAKIDQPEYLRIQKILASKAELSRYDHIRYGDPGTQFVPLEGEPKLYLVVRPNNPKIKPKQEEMIKSRAADKMERYNKHLNWTAIDAYNSKWLGQEQGWETLLVERDTDYVTWLTHPVSNVVFDFDFDDSVARQEGKRKPEQLWADVYDAVTLLDTTARCYGGGGLAEPSMKNLLIEFAKDECDPKNRVGRALLSKFSLSDKVKSDQGTQADFVDAGTSVKDGYKEFKEAWQEWRAPAASSATILALTAQETTSRLEQVAQSPALAAKLGLKYALKQAGIKQVIWVRAAAFHKFLESGVNLYYVSVMWDSLKWTHRSRQLFSEFKLCPFPPLQLVGAAP